MNALTHLFNRAHEKPDQPHRRVVDAATRAFHWLFALSFIGAYITADGERWRHVHTTLGYTMIGLLVARIIWGFFGPKRGRISSLIQRVTAIGPGLRSLHTSHSFSSLNWSQVQNAVMATLILALLALTIPLVLSGYLTDIDFAGDVMEELHEFFGEFYLMTVVAHVGLILLLSMLRRKNLVTPMLTGRIPGRGPDLAKHNHMLWASVTLIGVLSWWIWSFA